jgi:hypothetical protein
MGDGKKGFQSHWIWMRVALALAITHGLCFVYGAVSDSRVAALWGLAGTLTWSAVTVAFWIKARQDDL